MTDETIASPARPSALVPKRSRPPRADAEGRAYAGSQMCLQVWVNRRQNELSARLLGALGITDPNARVQWKSPLEKAPGEKGFREYKDGAFLARVGLSDHRSALAAFWPTGGPVWDGLAVVTRPEMPDLFMLVEAKSYPGEVLGRGCVATEPSLGMIGRALDKTAAWLGVERPDSWMGALYQSANRIAHVYFLRERLGLDAVMVNVCFTGDTSHGRSTTEAEWMTEKKTFRKSLGLTDVVTPWLVDLLLEAPRREELMTSGS